MKEVRAKKHLGQHFLTDETVAYDIANALVCDTTPAVLEVGPGMGVLTKYLINRPELRLQVAEIDAESVTYLNRNYPSLDVIEGDFLKMNLTQAYPDGVNIIGNFPYNISSQIFFAILDHKEVVPEIVGMLQKEVAVRLAATPTGKEYGILSVLLQAYYDVEYLFEVPPTVFNPPPKVQSAVIRARRNGVKSLDCDEVLLKQVIKTTFNQRRKTIRNSIKALLPNPTEEHRFFAERPERLSVSDFVELTNWVACQLKSR